jgi:predicted ArsR family transcriptional regulator
MLSALFGNKVVEKVLYYLAINAEGYPRGIAKRLGVALYAVQRQLQRLESDRIVLSRLVGRTRVYRLSPVWPLKAPLAALLDAAIKAQGREKLADLYAERQRPRRAGKPL